MKSNANQSEKETACQPLLHTERVKKKKMLKLYAKAFTTTCDTTNKSEHLEKGDTEDDTRLKLTKEVFE